MQLHVYSVHRVVSSGEQVWLGVHGQVVAVVVEETKQPFLQQLLDWGVGKLRPQLGVVKLWGGALLHTITHPISQTLYTSLL